MVFKSLHKPIAWFGVPRPLFFFIFIMAYEIFILSNSIKAAAIFFVGLFLAARIAMKIDHQLFPIIARSTLMRAHYDAAKQAIPNVEIR